MCFECMQIQRERVAALNGSLKPAGDGAPSLPYGSSAWLKCCSVAGELLFELS